MVVMVDTCPTCQRPVISTRLALNNGMCPLCFAGPFRVPLSHIARVHGLNRHQARKLLGLGRQEPVCDPAHSARARAEAIRRGLGFRKEGSTA